MSNDAYPTTYSLAKILSEASRGSVISKEEALSAMKRYLDTGVLSVNYKAWNVVITRSGASCDCGKGIFCPLNEWVSTG